MRKIRVLVVDDSAVVRRLLTQILSAEPDMEVVAAAPNAALARGRFEALKPDVVTMDVELPDVSGLELLSELRKLSPKTPVIMFSSLTQKAAATTLDALSRGAADYVTKPSQAGSREEAEAQVRSALVPKIRALINRRWSAAPVAIERKVASPLVRPASGRVAVVAIGSSTGGPNALSTLFRRLPGSLPVPIVVVQHMPPLFTRLLAERLSNESPIQVREAVQGDVLEPGKAYVAPGDFHMQVVRDKNRVSIHLDQGPPESSCRPAVDPLFRSVAAVYGGQAIGVVLTGMGQDGLRGVEQLRGLGAHILVQDESSSVVWGMPGAVARAGLADATLTVPDIADEILRRVMSSARVQQVTRG